MDKLKFDFFDVLGYLIPGTALLLALWVTADASVVSLMDLYGFVSKINTNTLLSGLVVAYIMGFTLHFLGSFLFHQCFVRLKNGGKAQAKPKRKDRGAYVALFWAHIREHGAKHLPILDRWQALKALSSNLAAFSLVAVCLCFWKYHTSGSKDWLMLSPVFLLLYFSYSNRAFKFGEYLEGDAEAVVNALELKSKLPAKHD